MPTYEFVCNTCGDHFEKNLKFSADLSQVPCPNGHTHSRKVFSVPIVVYKGSGFYVNDSRNKGGKSTKKSK
jgi:putative FmdB family regulatory protein